MINFYEVNETQQMIEHENSGCENNHTWNQSFGLY